MNAQTGASQTVVDGTMLHVVQHMIPGGIETLVLDLMQFGSPRDCVVSLYGTAPQLAAAWPKLRAIDGRLIGLDAKPGLRPGLVRGLLREIRDRRPSCVVAHHLGPLLYGGAAASLGRVPSLIHFAHDAWSLSHGRHPQILKVAERLYRPRHIAVSDAIADTLRSMLPGADVSVVPPGIDTDRFRPHDRAAACVGLGLDPALRYVGTAGRLVPVKGHEVLIEALPQLPADIHAVIAGNGAERDNLMARAAELGVTDRLHMLGHRDDLEAILPAFDLFCLPSLNEGLPRSVLEAQACGLPVVATDVGALRSAVCPETGLIVPPSNAGALAEAIVKCLSRRPDPAVSRTFVDDLFSFKQTFAAVKRLTAPA